MIQIILESRIINFRSFLADKSFLLFPFVASLIHHPNMFRVNTQVFLKNRFH